MVPQKYLTTNNDDGIDVLFLLSYLITYSYKFDAHTNIGTTKQNKGVSNRKGEIIYRYPKL